MSLPSTIDILVEFSSRLEKYTWETVKTMLRKEAYWYRPLSLSPTLDVRFTHCALIESTNNRFKSSLCLAINESDLDLFPITAIAKNLQMDCLGEIANTLCGYLFQDPHILYEYGFLDPSPPIFIQGFLNRQVPTLKGELIVGQARLFVSFSLEYTKY